MPIKYANKFAPLSITYPMNVANRKSASSEVAPVKVNYKKDTTNDTVWEPNYMRFTTEGKNSVWLGDFSAVSPAFAYIECSYDRLNWVDIPRTKAEALEFGKALGSAKETLYLRAKLPAGQTRIAKVIDVGSTKRCHFCWGSRPDVIPQEILDGIIEYKDSAIDQFPLNGNGRPLLDRKATAPGYSIYFIPKTLCETYGITHVTAKAWNGQSTTISKYQTVMTYAKGSNYAHILAKLKVKETITTQAIGLSFRETLDFSDDAEYFAVSCVTGSLNLKYTGYNPINGVKISGSFSSLIDGVGNADWAQDHYTTSLCSYAFACLFTGINRWYTQPLTVDWSEDAIIDASELIFPYDDTDDSTKWLQLSDNQFNSMFSNCTFMEHGPKKLPFKNSAVSCYCAMFACCTSLKEVPEIALTTTSNTCCVNMFYCCFDITKTAKLNVSNLATSCFESMYERCTALTTAEDLPNISTVNGSAFKRMFYECKSLTTPPKFVVNGKNGFEIYHTMFNGCSSLRVLPEFYDGTTITTTTYESNYREMFANSGIEDASSLTIDTSSATGKMTFYGTFAGCHSLVKGPKITIGGTTSSGSFQQMFYQCDAMTEIDASIDVTSPAANAMYSTFEGCTSLIHGPKKFIVKNPLGGAGRCTFKDCTSMTSLGEEGFVIEAGNMNSQMEIREMFYNCTSLLHGPSRFVLNGTTSGTSCYKTFQNCKAMTSMGEDGFEITITKAAGSSHISMFDSCESLVHGPEKLNITGPGGDNAYQYMFNNCKTMTSLGEDEFVIKCDTHNNSQYYSMFNECNSLLKGPKTFIINGDVGSSSLYYMFRNCKQMTEIGSDVCTIEITNIKQSACNNTFNGCTALIKGPSKLIIKNSTDTTAKAGACAYMFSNCTSMTNLGWDGFEIDCANLSGNDAFLQMFINDSLLVNGPTKLKLAGKLDANACGQMFSLCTNMQLPLTGMDISGVTAFGASACFQMFNQCDKVYGPCPAFPENATINTSAFEQMYFDCFSVTAFPDIPYKALGTYQKVFSQTFWQVGAEDHGGTRPTSINCYITSGTGANATLNILGHFQEANVQFHVPAGNPYGWTVNTNPTAVSSTDPKVLPWSTVIIDDL